MKARHIAFPLFAWQSLSAFVLAFSYCNLFDTHLGAVFDVSGLTRSKSEQPFTIFDGDIPCTSEWEPKYTYIFNNCGHLHVGPNIPSKCQSLPNFDKVSSVRMLDHNETTCEITGLLTETSTEIKLLDTEDPSKGIRLTYYGDYCDNPVVQKKFMIDLECSNEVDAKPIHAYEWKHCEYSITMPSIHGCPIECPIINNRVCGGNGFCGYDNDAGTSRCYCNQGLSGSDCNKYFGSETSSLSSIIITLIVILSIVIVSLFIAITVLYKQIKNYEQDYENYRALHTGGMMGGSQTTVDGNLNNNVRVQNGAASGQNEPDTVETVEFGVIESI